MQVSVTGGGTMELVAGGAVYPHFQVLSNELSTPRVLLCPNDDKQAWATNFLDLADTNLSYFLNVDAKADYDARGTDHRRPDAHYRLGKDGRQN